MSTTTGELDYAAGAELGDAGLWLSVNKDLVDFGVGTWTFEVKGYKGASTYFTKVDGITGQTGTGRPTDGTPNVVIAWATSGELDQFPKPGTYHLQVKARNAAGKDHIWTKIPITIGAAAT